MRIMRLNVTSMQTTAGDFINNLFSVSLRNMNINLNYNSMNTFT